MLTKMKSAAFAAIMAVGLTGGASAQELNFFTIGTGGTAATYSAAGAVRHALSEAGFDVTRVPGFGRKRHMTCARMPDAE